MSIELVNLLLNDGGLADGAVPQDDDLVDYVLFDPQVGPLSCRHDSYSSCLALDAVKTVKLAHTVS